MIDRLLDQGYASTDICSALIHLLQGAPAAGAEKKPSRAAKGINVAAAERSDGPAVSPSAAPTKSAPSWTKQRTQPKPRVPADAIAAGEAVEPANADEPEEGTERPKKSKYERPARTGREPGMTTVFLNVGRKQLVTPADVVGKISGVTRLHANVVGAIDIHQRHTLVDVAEAEAPLIVKKLEGIKLKGVALAPALTSEEAK